MPNSAFLAPETSPAFHAPDLFPFNGWAQRFLPLERIREIYRRAQQPASRSLLENVLSEMRVEYRVLESDLERIPVTGSVIVTANHPFGLLDGAILGALLARVRPDAKIMTNFLLSGIPELHEHCIFVDPFRNPRNASMNLQALRRAIFWLRTGGMLAMFPSGEVSHLDLRSFDLQQLGIAHQEWSPTVGTLLRLTGANALPIFFNGRNSARFQTMGLFHPALRTAWLLNEFLAQAGKKVEVCVGSTISAQSLRQTSGETPGETANDQETASYLRWRTYLLAHRGRTSQKIRMALLPVLPQRKQSPVADPAEQLIVLAEMEALRAKQCLAENREFAIYLAKAYEIPRVMEEFGRLRELTFRAVGEGTGKPRDLDKFDDYYQHLLLWSKQNHELVGAYRLGATPEILPRLGVSGLYTSTLFRYDPQVFEQMGPALELGRSFIRVEYQRQYGPLLMLWKGIGRYLASHPELAVVFGAVSISSRYNQVSRELIARFFQAREKNNELSHLIKPRRPFQPDWVRRADSPVEPRELEDLAGPIGDLETDGKGIPILIRQYAKLGGRLLSFNVDRNFSGVLDGLVLVDLRNTDPSVLARYMGKDESAAFRRYHRL
jgi:putative hemolysin